MIIDIPGVGPVEFPDDMPPEQMQQAASQAYMQAVATSQRPFEGQDPNEWKAAKAQLAKTGGITAPQGQAAIDHPVEQDIRDPGGMNAFLLGAQQGATFGFGDEISAGLASLSPSVTYDQALGDIRGMQANAEFSRPKTSMAGQVAGGALASGTGITGAAKLATTMGGKMGLGALSGTLEGGLYGFGSGEGGMAPRAESAAKMAAVGGVAGAAAPVVMAGARAAGRAVANPIMNLLNIGSNTQASRAIEKMMSRSGMSADDAKLAMQAATREGQPEFVLADALGVSGQRGLSGIARQPGDARQQIADMLMSRQDEQGNRLSNFVADGLGAPDTAAARKATLTAARSAAANVDYPAARAGAGPVDVRGAVGAIDDRVGPMRGMGVALDGIDKKLEGFRNRLAARNPAAPNSAVELSDFDRVLGVKQDLGDAIGEATRAGRNNEARELMKLQSELDSALEVSSQGYRTANDNFAKASRTIDAVDEGSAATSGRLRSEDTLARYGSMTPEQQAAFKAGYADPLIAKMDASAPGVNKARPLLGNKPQAELGALASDPAKLQRQIGREQTMFETTAQALGGSRTADNLADINDTKSMSASVIMNLLSMRPGAAAAQVADKLLSSATGKSPKTRELIAKMLLSQDPSAAIAPAVRRTGRNATQDAIAGILARSAAINAQ